VRGSVKFFVLLPFFFLNQLQNLYGFEKTSVLPKGIRNFTVKQITTSISEKYNSQGKKEPLAKPLEKDLTFQKIVDKETGTKQLLLKSFLKDKFNLNDSLGNFLADMKANVAVTVPVLSYGISDSLTMAIAIPYYQAKVAVSLGFKEDQNAKDFIAALHSEDYNQTQAARDVAHKVNNAVDGLNQKLLDNNFSTLKNWQGEGIGDITLATKYRFLNEDFLKCATTNGLTIPSGRVSNTDILNDLPFGSGTWDFFTSFILDEHIIPEVFFNQYFKYTRKTASNKNMRLATNDESIEVEKDNINYKTGDVLNLGTSIQADLSSGWQGGLGYSYEYKFQDRYEINEISPRKKAEDNTEQKINHFEARLAYSTVKSFKQKNFPVPLVASLEIKKQIKSLNVPNKDLITMDFSIFF